MSSLVTPTVSNDQLNDAYVIEDIVEQTPVYTNVIRYIDKFTGRELAASDAFEVELAESYDYRGREFRRAIPGYILVEMAPNAHGKFHGEATTIDFMYQPLGKIIPTTAQGEALHAGVACVIDEEDGSMFFDPELPEISGYVPTDGFGNELTSLTYEMVDAKHDVHVVYVPKA